ncbi:hypothetical protein TNCV_4313111 [Trichonephila clavipes]|nr:hypothetical protein TNCV_4313111 [Trichonephila clavipes]
MRSNTLRTCLQHEKRDKLRNLQNRICTGALCEVVTSNSDLKVSDTNRSRLGISINPFVGIEKRLLPIYRILPNTPVESAKPIIINWLCYYNDGKTNSLTNLLFSH